MGTATDSAKMGFDSQIVALLTNLKKCEAGSSVFYLRHFKIPLM